MHSAIGSMNVLGLMGDEILKKRLATQWLRRWIPNPGVPCSKPLGGSKVNSAFHPSEVDKMSNMNFWELNSKKKIASSKWL